jgi:hypothetical protein
MQTVPTGLGPVDVSSHADFLARPLHDKPAGASYSGQRNNMVNREEKQEHGNQQ